QEGVYEWAAQAGMGNKFRLARGWVDYLRLSQIRTDVARAAAGSPLLRLLRHLVISGSDYDDPGFGELLPAPLRGSVRVVELGEGDQGRLRCDQTVDLVQKMPKIEELRLYAHGVDVQKLFALPLPCLRVLHVNPLHEYPLEVLAANRS